MAGQLDRYSTLHDLLTNDAAKTALIQQLGPAFLQAPDLAEMLDMPLMQVAGYAPQAPTPQKLDAIQAALDPAVRAGRDPLASKSAIPCTGSSITWAAVCA